MSDPINQGLLDELKDVLTPNPPAGDPPAGDPPAGDPPAGDPPVQPNPPAGDPPAGDPPAGDPPAGDDKTGIDWLDTDPVKPNKGAQTPPASEPNPDIAFLDDPEIKAIIDAKKAGKSFFELASEISGPDIKSMTDDQVVALGLKTFENLNDEELEAELARYEDASPLMKKRQIAEYRKMFEIQSQEKLKQLGAQSQDQIEKQQIALMKLDQDLNGFASKMVNQEMFGYKVTDDMSKSTLDAIRSGEFNFVKEDGTFDAERMFTLAFIEKNLKEIVKVNITKAKNLGRKEVIATATNPSTNKTSDNAPVINPPNVDDAVESYMEKRKQ